jgi:serine/threonine protein kinase
MSEVDVGEITRKGDINEVYVLGEEIGRGSFSTVRKGRNKQTKKEYAIKVIQKKFIKLHLLER